MAGKKASKDLLHSAVRDYEIKKDDVNSIFSNMANSGGFESRNLAEGVDILRRMNAEKNCTKFLSFVGALMSTAVAAQTLPLWPGWRPQFWIAAVLGAVTAMIITNQSRTART